MNGKNWELAQVQILTKPTTVRTSVPDLSVWSQQGAANAEESKEVLTWLPFLSPPPSPPPPGSHVSQGSLRLAYGIKDDLEHPILLILASLDISVTQARVI